MIGVNEDSNINKKEKSKAIVVGDKEEVIYSFKGLVSNEMNDINYKWLPTDLKTKIFHNIDYRRLKTMFSTFDWLREIRFQCPSDYYDFLDPSNDPLNRNNNEVKIRNINKQKQS